MYLLFTYSLSAPSPPSEYCSVRSRLLCQLTSSEAFSIKDVGGEQKAREREKLLFFLYLSHCFPLYFFSW